MLDRRGSCCGASLVFYVCSSARRSTPAGTGAPPRPARIPGGRLSTGPRVGDTIMEHSAMHKKSSALGWKGTTFLLVMIPAMVLLPLWFLFLGPKLRHDKLVKNGKQVPGRLLDVEETGTYINDAPELEIRAEFRREDGTLDTASTDFVPSLRSIHLFQTGATAVIAYDPEDPDEITIIGLGEVEDAPAAPVTSVPVMERTVDSLRQIADSLRRVGDSLRRETGR